MRRYIIFTNIVLFILFIFLSMQDYNGFRKLYLIRQGDLDLKENTNADYEKDILPASVIAGIGRSADYYNVIPEKDLFRQERKEYEAPLPSEEDVGDTVEDGIKPPAVDLYGIMIEGQKKIALLYDKQEKEQNLRYKVVSPGTDIQGFNLIKIDPEQLIFEKNGKKAILVLSHQKQARGGIMSLGKGGAKVITKKAETREEKGSQLAISVETSSKETSGTKRKSAQAKEDENAEYKVVDTPFGKVKRKVKK